MKQTSVKVGQAEEQDKSYNIPAGSYGMCVCSRLCARTKLQCVCGADRLPFFHRSLGNLSQDFSTDSLRRDNSENK